MKLPFLLVSVLVIVSVFPSCDMSKDAVLASDMPITVHDINVASQGRIALVIVPFASREIIEQADKYSMGLITTGMTNILY